jgi:hypothetical protein
LHVTETAVVFEWRSEDEATVVSRVAFGWTERRTIGLAEVREAAAGRENHDADNDVVEWIHTIIVTNVLQIRNTSVTNRQTSTFFATIGACGRKPYMTATDGYLATGTQCRAGSSASAQG